MIDYPHKRIYALLGPPRAGKSTVAKYLQESRNFVALAFADKIKEEYGLDKEDFEAAKVSGHIGELRKKLWDFSDSKKKSDPLYFIKLVISEAIDTNQSVVITDIRTPEELVAINNIDAKVYFVCKDTKCLRDEFIEESKITSRYVKSKIFPKSDEMGIILNYTDSSYKFIHQLEKVFFKEDLVNLSKIGDWKSVDGYVRQFNITEAHNWK